MKHLPTSFVLALAGFLIGTAPKAAAFPATKDSAIVTLTFNLLPTAGASGTASGTVVIDVTRTNGVSTSSPLDITLTGLAEATYSIAATLKSDAGVTPVAIGPFTVSATPDPAATPLSLPAGLDPFNIATITVSDATPTVVLSGPVTETIEKWTYMGNRPLTAPTTTVAAPPDGHGPKPKALHGHVLIQNRIVNGVENKRHFLLVAQGAAADSTYTINLDGVAVGSVTSTKNGKLMAKSLDGDFRLAGTHLLTITDGTSNVIAQADFFPSLP
jgi:hypothetical protein